MNAGTQVMEDFWGVALTKNQREFKWEAEESDSESLYTEKSLELRQACLGGSAKDGERNVVELITDNEEGEAVTHTLLSMRVGGTEQSPLFLTLNPPVTFKLVQGNGPVHIVGQINETIDLSLLDNEEEEDDEEEEEEEKIEASKAITTSLKRPATSPSKVPAKMARLEPSDAKENGAMEWDTGSEDEEEEEEEEDSEEDQDESDEDEEEEEEDEVRPTPKKAQVKANGRAKNDTPHPKSKVVKTPQPLKSSKPKGSRSVPTTPKVTSEKKKTPGKGVADISEIKEKLTKMSCPKKLEKFNNFVTNSFKIKDDSVKKQLWEFVQKNRPQA